MHGYSYFLHFLRNRELDELYASVAIRSFAMSMINIFIPIYLLKLNYSLPSVLLFYAILNLVHALFVIPAAKISSKFGFKHSILFSIPLLLFFYILLYTLEMYQWPLYLLAIIFGINNSLFWVGYHTDFARFSKMKYRGEEIGFVKIFSSIFSVAGPLIGGLILAFTSFKFLYIIVSLLLFISAIPLFFSRDIHNPTNFSIKQIFTDQKIKDYLAFIGHGIESGVGATIWPIFIFFSILNSFASLGFITTLSLFFSLIFMFIIGRFSDVRRRLVLRLGGIFNAIIWGIKTIVTTSFQVFVIDSFYGITRTMREVPFDALSYDKANKRNIVEFIVFREIVIQTGRVILFISMMFIADFVTGFIFGGGASLLYLLF